MVQQIVFSLPGTAPNNVAPGLSVNRCDFTRWKMSWLSETEQSPHLTFLWSYLRENLVLMVKKSTPSLEISLGKQAKEMKTVRKVWNQSEGEGDKIRCPLIFIIILIYYRPIHWKPVYT